MTPEASSRSELPEPKVFISYRREETAAYAGRLYDSMAATFGDRNVFMDVDLAPGIDFVDRITNAVSACHVLIVVLEGLQQLQQYQENWISYRSTCERLRAERFLYLSRAGPYSGGGGDALLAARVEGLVSQENAAWVAQRDDASHQADADE